MSSEARRLSVHNLRRSFGGIVAVNNISFDLEADHITGLIGPNGAGKTTVFNLLAGSLKPDSGSVEFEGEPIVGLNASTISRRGIARCFQSATVFRNVTVRDHIVRAGYLKAIGRPFDLLKRRSLAAHKKAARDTAEELLDFLELRHAADRDAATLAYGHQKILGVGMALATQPRLLLADEPAAGLNPVETSEMAELLRRVRYDRGIDVLLVEHDLRLVMKLCDRIIALNAGAIIADGPPNVVRNDEAFITAYLGADHAS
jgi:branched-chain amino acid transport system ATP-binding protein